MIKNQKTMEQYNKIFDEKMESIGLMPLIKNYETIKQSAIRNSKKFEQLSKSFRNRKDEKIKVLYKEVCEELENIKMLRMALDGIIGALKVIVNENKPSQDTILKLSNMFKQKLKLYDASYYRFKEIFVVLKNVANNKSFETQKTR